MSFVVALAMLAAPAAEVPEEPHNTLEVNLSWSAPAECPDAVAFLHKVEQVSGQPLEFDLTATIGVEGRVHGVPEGGYRLELTTLVDEQREDRTFEATTCDAVVEASALVTALALEPHTRSTTDPPLVPEPIDHAAAPLMSVELPGDLVPTPVAMAQSASHPPGRRHSHALLVRAEGAAGVGLTTPIAAGVGGGIGWQWGHARVDLGARHWFRRSTAEDPGVDLTLSSGSVRGCFVPGWGPLELPLCGGVEVGGLRARGTGTGIVSELQTTSWVGVTAGAALEYAATPRLGLVARVDVVVLPSRPVFHVDDPGGNRTVYVAGPVNARIGLGLRARFSLGE